MCCRACCYWTYGHAACQGGGSRTLHRGQPCDCVCLLQHVLAVAHCACLQLLRLPLQAGMLLHPLICMEGCLCSHTLPLPRPLAGEGQGSSRPSCKLSAGIATLPSNCLTPVPCRLQQEGEGQDGGGAAGHAGSHEGKAAKGLCWRGCKPVCACSSRCYPCAVVRAWAASVHVLQSLLCIGSSNRRQLLCSLGALRPRLAVAGGSAATGVSAASSLPMFCCCAVGQVCQVAGAAGGKQTRAAPVPLVQPTRYVEATAASSDTT